MIISRTPLRISFFGGGSDYPAYFNAGHEGLVLGASINKYVYISINKLSPFFDHSIRVTYSRAELVKDLNQIEHPSVRECLRFFNIPSDVEIHHIADLPARTGLGSSSAFTVGLLNALYAFRGQMVRKERLAQDAIMVEQQKICERVGCQDQYLTALGGINLISFFPDRTIIEPVPLTTDKRESLQNSLMLFYTRITRQANEVVKEQLERTSERKNDQVLASMVKMTRQSLQILLSEKTPENFGRLMHENWLMKKSLASNITTALVDTAYEKARQLGAWGGKLAGAGGGGFLLICSPEDAKPKIRQSLSEMGLTEVQFSFESDGSRIVYYQPET